MATKTFVILTLLSAVILTLGIRGLFLYDHQVREQAGKKAGIFPSSSAIE